METLNTPRRKEPPRIRTGPSLNQDSLSRKVSLSSKTENRTFYNNPVSVRQWAAETDTNAPVDFTEHGLLDSTYGADATVFCDAAQHPGPLPISCSSASPVSFPVTSGFQGDDLSAACTYPDHNGMARSLGDALGLETYSGCDFTKNYETWSYPTQTVEDITYSTSTISCLPFGGDSTTEPRFPDWSMTFFPTDNETSREDFSCGSQSLGWSPMLATDPSVSSSFSRSSYLALQANTPLSPVAQEPDWPTDLTTCQEETVFYPAFSLGEPSHPPGYSTGHQDPMR